MTEIERAAEWFENRAKTTPMSGARRMFELASESLREKANGVTAKEWISVNDKLPGKNGSYLVCSDAGQIYICELIESSKQTNLSIQHRLPSKAGAYIFYSAIARLIICRVIDYIDSDAFGYECLTASHWLPLPNPPQTTVCADHTGEE